MKFASSIVLLSSALALSACLPEPTTSSFQTPAADGSFVSDADVYDNFTVSDLSGNGYAYQLNLTETTILGIDYYIVGVVAGVLPTTTVGTLPSAGSVVMAGEYEVIHLNLLQLRNGELSETSLYAGPLELVANFGAGTLTGTDGALFVEGVFTSTDLDGTVTYLDMTGDLDGIIDGSHAVAVFQGSNFDEVLVGGFNVN